MSKRYLIRFERYWQGLKLTIAGGLLSAFMLEALFWARDRINISIDLFKTKVSNELEMTKQYQRQSTAMEQILEEMKKPRLHCSR